MSKPYDATPKALLEIGPADWPPFLGVPARTVEIVNADVSTVKAAADKVLLVRADQGDRIQHIEFQAGPDISVPRRTHGYNALLEERHGLPVESVVILLRPEADLAVINGVYQRCLPATAGPYLQFHYRVIRVWEFPVATVLQAGISLLPLAPISAVGQNELLAVIQQIRKRLDAETDQGIVGELWTATKVLLGLRYQAEFIDQLLHGVRAMKESTTYQAILEEGRQEGIQKGRQEGIQKGRQEGLEEGLQTGRREERPAEARRLLIQLGEKRFGTSPSPEQRAALEAITDPARLEELVLRTLYVGNWADLLE
jgi:predicted transposase YdaD